MKIGGFRLFATIALVVLSIWYLFPTAQRSFENSKIAGMSEEERDAYTSENSTYLASLNDNALQLGLDLQGGMHVTLEVGVEALVRDLAIDTDDVFEEVLQAAHDRVGPDDNDFISVFVDEFESRDPDGRLSRYFRSPEDDITRRSSNADVKTYLDNAANSAIDAAMSIIRDRIDRYGVAEPAISKSGTRRIVAELPGVTDPERVRNLLKGTAKLEFHLMGEPTEVSQSLNRIIAYYNANPDADGSEPVVEPALTDSTEIAAADSAGVSTDSSEVTDVAANAATDSLAGDNPLLALLTPTGGTSFGQAVVSDTSKVMALLRAQAVRPLWPQDVTPMWTSSPVGTTEDTGQDVYLLLAIRNVVELTGETLTDARVQFNQFTNQPEVTMAMSSEGSSIWSRLTGANVGKQVAVVMDNVVYSYPVIREKISGGRTSIEGLDSTEEAEDVVTVLKSGSLPAPVQIVEERTVGPSLGAASIRAGTWSVIVGLLVVALFMIMYYRTGGIIANLALLLNIVFIFGILASFKATLTLPGIAGIVLTIGMAVDANVLIFDRIREEMRGGKALKAAVESGYGKALSAIADANITTFFVGAILFSFGVGAIQGFAVTLMAGIVSSLFTAIIVTRIITDWLLFKKNANISYG